jgi:superfamily I DNA/RNA helicase/DNA polymerase III epsilon subunit-like protein
MSFEPTRQQRDAIEAPLGPVLVIAGPGAGKTFCLIHRIQYLIGRLDIAPRRILAVTFTNKAAEEIATRLHEERGITAVDVTRGTLHAICLMILRDFAERCGLRPGFGIADHEYQEQVLRRLRIPAKRCSQALAYFSLYRLQGKPLSDRGLAFFAQYREALRSRNLADFDDLITLTEELLRTDESAAAELRSRWDYVLVDEFQDLSPTQYGIVRRLADKHRCLFGVGDDEQSIFSWTGADPGIMGRFREDFNLNAPIVLDENRRCSIQILDSARRLIACNPVLFEKQIDTTLKSPFEVLACGFDNEEAEADWLIRDILSDRATAQTGWGDYAVLYRYRWMGRDLEKRLICAGIPCRMARGQALVDDKVVGWVIASLRVIRSPDDPILLGALTELALNPAVRQEVRKSSSREKDFLVNLRAFASQRPKGDADRRRVWRLIYHLENLRGMGRSHQSLSGLVDELLARPIGAGRNPLEEYHHDLTEPSLYPGAAAMATRLAQCVASGSRVWVEPSGGVEIPLVAMLRGAGITNAHRLMPDDVPAADDMVLGADQSPEGGLPLRLFKALQLVHSRNLKADFDNFVAFDIETSDFDFDSSQIVDLAAVRVRDNVVVGQFQSLVSCTRSISAPATEIHGYHDGDLIGAPPMSEVWQRFREFVGTDLVVAHNGQEFDVPVLRRACRGFEGFDELVFYDTLPLARAVVDGSVKLKYLAQKFNIEVGREHHALDDAVALAKVVPNLNELRIRRGRTVALVHLLDQLGLALALDQHASPTKEEALFREITRPFTLGRYSDCLDIYAAELASGSEGSLGLEEVIEQLGGRALMERLRTDRPVDERYPDSVERLRMLIQASAGETLADHIDDMLRRVALSSSEGAETDPNRLNLLTLHSTKGLEFSRVYVVGVENQVLPGWRAIQEDRTPEIQEARRLLYVGMTRAKHRLVLTHAEQRGGYRAQGHLFITEAGLVLEDLGISPALDAPVISE